MNRTQSQYVYVNDVPTLSHDQYRRVTQSADSVRLALFLNEHSDALTNEDDWDRLFASIPWIEHC